MHSSTSDCNKKKIIPGIDVCSKNSTVLYGLQRLHIICKDVESFVNCLIFEMFIATVQGTYNIGVNVGAGVGNLGGLEFGEQREKRTFSGWFVDCF